MNRQCSNVKQKIKEPREAGTSNINPTESEILGEKDDNYAVFEAFHTTTTPYIRPKASFGQAGGQNII